MSADSILVTGGAGFIGSHLVDRLIAEGRRVRVLDVLEPQVHGSSAGLRNPRAEYIRAAVSNRDEVARALDGVEGVVHLAAQVGVGQSMYEMERYTRENTLGTAALLEVMAALRRPPRCLVVASSMSIYGEGGYACQGCGRTGMGVVRTLAALRAGRWEPVCRGCGAEARPLPTKESKPLECSSVYAITKRDQEELCLVFGRAYDVRTVALRLFNVYGPRQSLSNPYTGVAAIFSSRLLNGRSPELFEDGRQTRDFVHVSDIVRAFVLALDAHDVGDIAINVGTGIATSVRKVACTLGAGLGSSVEPRVIGRFRQGDVRHCVADITLARGLLGYAPRVAFDAGMRGLLDWIAAEAPPAADRTRGATAELVARGLVV